VIRIELVRKSTKFLDRPFVILGSCPSAGCLGRMGVRRRRCPSGSSLHAAYVDPESLFAGSVLQGTRGKAPSRQVAAGPFADVVTCFLDLA